MRSLFLASCLVFLSAPLPAQTFGTAPLRSGFTSVTAPLGSGVHEQLRSAVEDLCHPILHGSWDPHAYYVPNFEVKSRCVTNDNGTLKPPPVDSNGKFSARVHWTGAALTATLTPLSWSLAGSELLASSCGRWSYRADLDPAVSSSSGDLTLWPTAGDPSRGVFSGTVPLAVRFHLQNVDLGLTYDMSGKIDLALRGSWTAPPPESFVPALPPDESNLRLYAWPLDLWWIHRPDCWETELTWQEGGRERSLSCDRCEDTVPPAIPGPPSCS